MKKRVNLVGMKFRKRLSVHQNGAKLVGAELAKVRVVHDSRKVLQQEYSNFRSTGPLTPLKLCIDACFVMLYLFSNMSSTENNPGVICI